MKIEREELLRVLNIAKPALATKEIVFETTHFWFTGKSVLAYDDKIGIEVPFETDFEGGLLGKLLIGVLEKSAAKEVTIEAGQRPREVRLKCGNARVDLSLLEPERAIWEFPRFNEKYSFELERGFIDALANMMISVGQNTSVPAQLGVTFSPIEASDRGDPGWLDLYSLDEGTMSWARIDLPEGYEVTDACVVPEQFCSQLISLTRKAGKMIVEKDCVLAVTDDGVKLYARLVDVRRLPAFAEQVEQLVPDPEHFVQLPARFGMAVERVSVLIDHLPGTPCELAVDREGMLRLFAKSDRGEIRDSIRLEGDPEEITAWFDPALMKRAVNGRTEFYISRDALIMRGPENFYHMISPPGSKR